MKLRNINKGGIKKVISKQDKEQQRKYNKAWKAFLKRKQEIDDKQEPSSLYIYNKPKGL